MKDINTTTIKIRRFTKQERLESKLSVELKNILIGLALGDLNIDLPQRGRFGFNFILMKLKIFLN